MEQTSLGAISIYLGHLGSFYLEILVWLEFFFIVCSSCDFFSFIKKKSWICFCFLFRTDRRRVCWEEVRGEQADRGNRAEKIRNWRKVRNAAFSWLPNSCNFYCHCLDPGHKAQRVGKGHVTTLPQIRIWHLNPLEARRMEGLLIYRFADELNEIAKMHFSCI